MEKSNSPLKAIRRQCRWCSNDSNDYIKNCPSIDCSLYELRFGKKVAGISSIKAIRNKCIDCREFLSEIRNCEHSDCPLHFFRFGKNPNRKGCGGNKFSIYSERALKI